MFSFRRLLVSLVLCAGHVASARPVVVFDLDHTLFDTNTRIVAMLRDLAVEFDIPELLAVTNEQVEMLRLRGQGALGLRNPKAAKLLFGRPGDHSLRHSPFGTRFYNDASYLVHDAVIPGAPQFVERIARELGADVYYITGRTEELFRSETEAQLARYDFPGYSSRRPPPPGEHRLILKPAGVTGSTDAWKVAEFAKLMNAHHVVAVFDDASRNVNAFARILPAGVPIVRITRDVSRRGNVDDRVELITNYVYNSVITPEGGRESAVNVKQLDSIIARAALCVRRLGE